MRAGVLTILIVSKALESKLDGAKIHTEILGSDHCPVELTIDI
mgnify:CR=1 FL=1